MTRKATSVVLLLGLLVLVLGALPRTALAHGSMQTPISRVYACYLEGPETPDSLACRDAIAMGGTQPLYDWNEVNIRDAGGRARELIPDGKLCSAGRDKYAAFDVPRLDWATTMMPASGQFTFVFNAYVPHNMGYFEFYVTRDGWDPLQPLKWSDLDATPFLRVDNPPLVGGNYLMSGNVPSGKSGRHLIYTIWQRNDSLEAFYACSDVWFGSSPTPTATQAPVCTAPAWNATTVYNAGDLVVSDGKLWKAKWSNSSSQPDSLAGSNPWEITGYCGTGAPQPTTAPPTATRTLTRTPTSGTPPTATRTATRTATVGGPTATRTRTATRTATVGGPTATRTRTATVGGPTATRTSTIAVPTATRTSTPSATPSTSCGGLPICDGFEGQTTGAAPGGSWQMIYPSCQGTGTAVVDGTVARSGSKSVRVDGKAGFCNHVFFGNTSSVAAIGPVLYGRVFVRPSVALADGHVSFITMKDINDGSKDLRLGGQNQVMSWNRESDDASVPVMSPAGVAQSRALPVNQWSCLELMVDGTNGYLSAWLNGSEIQGMRVDGVATADVDATWLSRANWHPSLSDVKLGWESYAGGDNTLWFDDVAFGPSRIGCGGTTPTPTTGTVPTATRTSTIAVPTATTGTVPTATRTSTSGLPTATRTSTIAVPTATTGTAPSGLRVQYRAGDTSATDNQIKPYLQVVNGGSTTVSLSELKLRYWYTADGTQAQQYFCDYAVKGCGNITGSFVKLATARTGADGYMEIGFTSGAGSLAAGQNSGEVQSRVAKSDWSNYTETGDYSYDPTKTAFADWSKVTLYRLGALAWGVEP